MFSDWNEASLTEGVGGAGRVGRELNTEPGVSMPRAEAIMLAAVLDVTEEKQDHKRLSRKGAP